jgi:hypothetical protein
MATPRRKVEFLEDILKRYGVEADYWPFPDDTQPVEAIPATGTTFEDAMTASENWREEIAMLAVDLASNRLHLWMHLGDVRAKAGKPQAALKAYEAAILNEDDPKQLCELGYLLLQRCRVDELPLCDKDFDGSLLDFGGGETLFISAYWIDPDNPGSEFPDKAALLHLAIRAFGVAYVSCMRQYWTAEKGATWEDRWHELMALEGLRAAFLSADNLEAVDSVRVSFNGWIEDYRDQDEEAFPGRNIAILWMLAQDGHAIEFSGKAEWDPEDDPDSFLNPFVANFNRTTAYLRGRRKAPPLPVSEDRLRHLIRSEICSGMEPVRRDLQSIRDLGEAAHSRMDGIVEKQIDLDQRSERIWERVRQLAEASPEAEKASICCGLKALLGHVWNDIERDSQEDLIYAKIAAVECERGRLDWYSPAVGYGRVAARELNKSVNHLRHTIFRVSTARDEMFGKLVEALTRIAAEAREEDELSTSARLLLQPQSIKRLRRLNRVRNRAAHPARRKVLQSDVREMEKLLLESEGSAKPLLALIAGARGSS